MLFISGMMAFGQRPIMELTFTAVDNTAWIQSDSIKVMNRTQGSDTVLYYPDTVLTINYVGIYEVSKNLNGFQVLQNYPNPVADHTTISLVIPEKDRVSLVVSDMLGRVIMQSERILDRGIHSFRFTPGSGHLFFFTAQWKGSSSSIKILQAGFNSEGESSVEYSGGEDASPQLKAIRAIQYFSFAPGDELLYIGYANGLESGILDSPHESQTYTFQFATNIPCPETPTVLFEGQVYNTIQIFSQCWLKENLNAGEMIPGSMEQSNNGIIEKYCYDNDTNNCNAYGGLYKWAEMMQYLPQQGSQGICPTGWHIPTDEEWKVLEGAVDSQYWIGDPAWGNIYWRGYDAGANLKTTAGWSGSGNGTDLFGFSGLPGGFHFKDGFFSIISHFGYWWSSAMKDNTEPWYRYLGYFSPEVCRDKANINEFGFSVRCLRDE